MKQTIIAVLLLITASKGIAQSHSKEKLHIFDYESKKWIAEAIIKDGSDTIEIMVPLQVHYIKIGDDVYQIVEHTPTIEKVQPTLQTLRLGGVLYGSPTNNFNNAILPITQ